MLSKAPQPQRATSLRSTRKRLSSDTCDTAQWSTASRKNTRTARGPRGFTLKKSLCVTRWGNQHGDPPHRVKNAGGKAWAGHDVKVKPIAMSTGRNPTEIHTKLQITYRGGSINKCCDEVPGSYVRQSESASCLADRSALAALSGIQPPRRLAITLAPNCCTSESWQCCRIASATVSAQPCSTMSLQCRSWWARTANAPHPHRCTSKSLMCVCMAILIIAIPESSSVSSR
mmetsp:Transcript_30931/g.82106  ORF Transcript_30931/g.82106 Transcript_30931/m.82106 type:complete len:230 (+) Transcript_30931:690-1379(+)